MSDTPTYLKTPEDFDAVARMCLALSAELWACKDRLAVLEECLAQRGLLDEDEVDTHEPSESLRAALEAERRRMVQRVMGVAQPERSHV